MKDFSRQIDANAAYCAARGILIPTFAQLRRPETAPEEVHRQLADIGLWDVHPRNLFRITWKNEPVQHGGGFGGVNHLVLPSALTGVRAKIVGLTGKWFPTGAHKVGATFGCLIPPLLQGVFDPAANKAAWPSTGNYCRGGAYVSKLLDCHSIAILPEGMSRERFQWLEQIADEVVKTTGCESNVKEIFDACHTMRTTRPEVFIFNQFEEMGNTLWHYNVTGPAMEDAVRAHLGDDGRFHGTVLCSGSGGTLAGGYYLKEAFPKSKLAVAEALQCPTLCDNGFGDHRIEGIGDKHVPWIHDVKNTDLVVAVDDAATVRLMRLFNEPEGRTVLQAHGVDAQTTEQLGLLGMSGIANMLAAVKYARYYELTERDVVLTVFTDSMEMYGSRMEDLRAQHGPYTTTHAEIDLARLGDVTCDHLHELSYRDRKRIHNLKYFTWVEQQGKDVAELNAQWYEHDTYWPKHLQAAAGLDDQIRAFNARIAHASGAGAP